MISASTTRQPKTALISIFLTIPRCSLIAKIDSKNGLWVILRQHNQSEVSSEESGSRPANNLVSRVLLVI